MSELAESLQARQQRTLSSANSSISQNQLAEDSSSGLFSEHHTLGAELKALSGCQLLRNPSEREGLTTFTVVPLRRQQSRQYFEVPLTLQRSDSSKAEPELCPGDQNALERATTKLLKTVPTEPLRNGSKGSDTSEHLSEVLHLQHVEQENQAWTDVESENLEPKDEEDQCIHAKNMELESLESLQSDRSPVNPNAHLEEQEELEEHALVETGEEKDWVEYKERRGKFLGGGNLEPKDEEGQCIHAKKIELESLELLQSGIHNLEHSGSMMNNQELKESANKLADRSPVNPNARLEEQEEVEEHALLETGEEMDWVEEYKERRKFPGGDNLEPKDEEDQCIHAKKIELESLESLQSDRSPVNPNAHLEEQEELEEHALVETGEEKDWVEYKERRKFLGGDNLEPKDEEDQCIHGKNIELKSFESLQSCICNPEHSGSTMNNQELKELAKKLANRSPVNPNAHPEEQEEKEEHALMETGEENDWVEEYKERRRKFLGGDNGLKKLDVWGKIQREFTNTQEMDFPSPPPPVCWDKNNGENEELQACDEDHDQWANLDLNPQAHSTQTNTDLNISGAENNCSCKAEAQRTSFLSKSHSSIDPRPPATVSLFALAVFQKAKHSKPGLDPNCSRRRELHMHTHSN